MTIWGRREGCGHDSASHEGELCDTKRSLLMQLVALISLIVQTVTAATVVDK